jgi:signal peptidase I
VIGLPGDTVELKGKTVYINGKPLEEPYVRFLFPDDLPSGVGLAGTDPRRKFGPVTVPPDMFFMMGDNRDNSEDSRFWGFMPRSYIKGKALFLYFSFGDANGLSGTLSNIRWGRMLHQIH